MSAGVMLEMCPVCREYFDHERAKTVLVHDPEDGPSAQRLAVCNECVQRICKCKRCSAWGANWDKYEGLCLATPFPSKDAEQHVVKEGYLCRDSFRQKRPWTWDDIREAFGGELPAETGTPPVDTQLVVDTQRSTEVFRAALRIAREMRQQWDRVWKVRDFRSFATTDDPCEPVIRSALGLLLNNHEVVLVGEDQWQWERDRQD
jgi:hypothetical protein